MKRVEHLLTEKKHVIWDWNGTLLNDVEVASRTINGLLLEHGLAPLNLDAYRKTFGFPVRDFYTRIGFDFVKHDWELIARDFAARFYEGLNECLLHEGARELLEALKTENRMQSILSASHEPELLRLLKLYDLHHLFDHVYGLSDHYAGSKLERGRELLHHSGIPTSETILIGDTDHDLLVGQALSVDVLLLAHGHQDYERLIQMHDKVIELSPRQKA
jgi:phosphoglycolate phosphatase